MYTILVLFSLVLQVFCLTREELIEHLKYQQEARNTFDSRVPRLIRPLGHVAGKPIWPRVLERVPSEADLFFDDDNFAYELSPRRDAAGLVREMDKEENYQKILKFLDKYT